MRVLDQLKIGGSIAAAWPLYTITNKSSLVAKIIATLAIAIFTTCSLGYYAIYSYRYLAARKFEAKVQSLESAIRANQLEAVRELFKATPNLKGTLNGYQGRTPNLLHLAVENEHTEMIDLLIANGARLDAESRMGSPLAVAVYRGKANMVQFLLERRANPNLGDGYRAPIYLASLETEGPAAIDLIRLLANANANLAINNTLWTPLTRVALHWDTHPEKVRETLLLLIQKGVRLGANDAIANPDAHQFILDNTPL
jgi:ankyrin repeat protein